MQEHFSLFKVAFIAPREASRSALPAYRSQHNAGKSPPCTPASSAGFPKDDVRLP